MAEEDLRRTESLREGRSRQAGGVHLSVSMRGGVYLSVSIGGGVGGGRGKGLLQLQKTDASEVEVFRKAWGVSGPGGEAVSV